MYGTSLSAVAEWPKALNDYFDKHYPGLVTVINSAENGVASGWGLENLDERVLSKNPDLVFIEFSMNDAATKHNISMDKSLANLDMMVKALHRQNPNVDIVLQTMSTVWDNEASSNGAHASARPQYPEYYQLYRNYAHEHRLSLLDHYPNWLKLQHEDEERFKRWLPDGGHPIPEASLAVTWPLMEALLEKARNASRTL